MNPITTLEESIAAEKAARERFEEITVAFECDGKPVTMAEARKVFEKYHPGPDWKRPVDARVPRQDLTKFLQAVRFYHGCEAHKVRAELVRPSMGMMFRVTTVGYCC